MTRARGLGLSSQGAGLILTLRCLGSQDQGVHEDGREARGPWTGLRHRQRESEQNALRPLAARGQRSAEGTVWMKKR